jgi:hypothetical protein
VASLDADRFVELCDLSRTAAPVDQRSLLTDALALWRGPVFDDLGDEPWALATASR